MMALSRNAALRHKLRPKKKTSTHSPPDSHSPAAAPPGSCPGGRGLARWLHTHRLRWAVACGGAPHGRVAVVRSVRLGCGGHGEVGGGGAGEGEGEGAGVLCCVCVHVWVEDVQACACACGAPVQRGTGKCHTARVWCLAVGSASAHQGRPATAASVSIIIPSLPKLTKLRVHTHKHTHAHTRNHNRAARVKQVGNVHCEEAGSDAWCALHGMEGPVC